MNIIKKDRQTLYIMLSVFLVLLLLFSSLIQLIEIKEERLLSDMPEPIENYELPEGIEGFELDNQPVKTYNKEAEINIIVFKDYKCPHCKVWHETVYPKVYKELIEPGLVNFYFVNFSLHENPHVGIDSLMAAVAGRAVYKQSNEAFWKFSDLIFEAQGPMTETWATKSFIIDLVEKHLSDEIDVKKFKKDIEDPSLVEEVYKNIKIGEREGVTGTPTVFVGNEKLERNDFASIMKKVNELMKE